MNNFQDTYPISELDFDLVSEIRNDYRFYFTSIGKKEIDKAIHYDYIEEIGNTPLFNLGFGDYDFKTDSILDEEISCNGDHYKVFYTILNTVPRLFDAHNDATLLVQGSDSMPEFIQNCKANCTRECNDQDCRKAHRRIRIYRNFVNKNFDNLNDEYDFQGSEALYKEGIAEPYEVGKEYISVLVKRKNNYYEN